MNGRGRVALVALGVLVVYLMGYAVKVAQDNRALQRQQRAALAALAGTQQNVVDQLARILEQAALAEAAGQVAQGSVARILDRVQGLDPALIKRAIEEASKRTGRPIAVPGPPGPSGPPGPAGAAAPTTTTSTAPAGTTSTTRSPTTTTSTTRPTPTTTTTRPCRVDLVGLVRIC